MGNLIHNVPDKKKGAVSDFNNSDDNAMHTPIFTSTTSSPRPGIVSSDLLRVVVVVAVFVSAQTSLSSLETAESKPCDCDP
jgi:hypothetical protein